MPAPITHLLFAQDKPNPGTYLETKVDAFRHIGASYLVDDQLKHCLAVAEAGINAVLFGNYAWNGLKTLPNNVVRCINWQAVGEYFEECLDHE